MDAMKDALAKRRGKGLDISILIGQPQVEDKEPKGGDLAPEVEGEGHEDIEQDKALIADELQKHDEKDLAQDEESFKQAMLEGHDQDQVEGMKPRSLGERVRMKLAKGK